MGVKDGVRSGLGDGFREDDFDGIPNLVLLLVVKPILDSVELVRLCDDGKLDMLLWITGDGPRSPGISTVPFRLGRLGLPNTGTDICE